MARLKIQEAVDAGEFGEAEALLDEVLEQAQAAGEAREIDRAYCNRAALAIELGQGERFVPELRQILVRNSDDESCFLAAYNIARFYEFKKANKKGLFYGRIARDRATKMSRTEWLASAHNVVGNLLLADSFFEEACCEYELALHLAPESSVIRRALIKENLGYSYVVQGKHREGLTLLLQSFRTLRRIGAARYAVFTRLTLCFSYLEVGRSDLALRCGRDVLAASETVGDRDWVKNALFLLGEASSLEGDLDGATSYFNRLQREFYPNETYLTNFLLAIDVRKMVNLKA
jgi:tetratricopeptide (TPR) repeat protein